MTYGFRPENWPTFNEELSKRHLTVADIERVEVRPASVSAGSVDVTVTLRSGRVESWRQTEGRPPSRS
jgi:hypothetical protein